MKRLLLAFSLAISVEAADRIDRDLAEATVPQLERFYETRRYTVTQVVNWYAARIAKYDGIYQAVETRLFEEARSVASREDAQAREKGFQPPSLWGVPIVVKANTSVAGHVTTDGWTGFVKPGHELVAPKDAPVVAKLRAAGAVVIGLTNLPDFAASDTTRSTSFGRTGNAYDVRFSPGGSSGGTVTSVAANFAMLGTGTDTGNSIRMPAATSALVGVLPTRGLVNIAGIAPLDWLRDNTGPIARTVTDAAIALGVMAEENPSARKPPYTQYLKPDAVKGKRLGVPAFIVANAPPTGAGRGGGLQPETRAMFMKAVEELRAAGATVVFDDDLLPASFQAAIRKVNTQPYRLDGTNAFLMDYGPPAYHSNADYERVAGSPLPRTITGLGPADAPAQMALAQDPDAEKNYFGPQREALSLYQDAMARFHLDGFVYPAAQMPPPDETMPQNGQLSSGPHSATGWVNVVGVPAVVVPAGFYPCGLPFGLELSADRWKDGDLLGWAYGYEQATRHRRPPVLVERGLLPRPQP